MKTKSIINVAAALLVLVPTASAQQRIKEAFAEVEEYSGVTKTGESIISTVDANDIPTESRVVTIKVKGKNVYRAVFDKVKEAFDKEGKNSSWAVIEKGTEGMDVDSATMHDLGLTRQLWSVWREGADAILVGNMKNSTYCLFNFDDKQHSGYRTCCAAEWSKSDVPDVYTAQLVYVYGRKPDSAFGENPNAKRSLSIQRSISRSPSDVFELTRQWNLPDSATFGNIMKRFENSDFTKMKAEDIDNLIKQAHQLQEAYGNNGHPTDLPFDGNMDTWMALAMQRGVSNLTNADWHRFFGLLTEKMMDKANKGSKEDLVVSAGIILDLCKNAPLDDDERQVAANRLIQVSEAFDDDKDEYIYDMLMLAKKKVQKK